MLLISTCDLKFSLKVTVNIAVFRNITSCTLVPAFILRQMKQATSSIQKLIPIYKSTRCRISEYRDHMIILRSAPIVPCFPKPLPVHRPPPLHSVSLLIIRFVIPVVLKYTRMKRMYWSDRTLFDVIYIYIFLTSNIVVLG